MRDWGLGDDTETDVRPRSIVREPSALTAVAGQSTTRETLRGPAEEVVTAHPSLRTSSDAASSRRMFSSGSPQCSGSPVNFHRPGCTSGRRGASGLRSGAAANFWRSFVAPFGHAESGYKTPSTTHLPT